MMMMMFGGNRELSVYEVNIVLNHGLGNIHGIRMKFNIYAKSRIRRKQGQFPVRKPT